MGIKYCPSAMSHQMRILAAPPVHRPTNDLPGNSIQMLVHRIVRAWLALHPSCFWNMYRLAQLAWMHQLPTCNELAIGSRCSRGNYHMGITLDSRNPSFKSGCEHWDSSLQSSFFFPNHLCWHLQGLGHQCSDRDWVVYLFNHTELVSLSNTIGGLDPSFLLTYLDALL